jgi:hypothetical protein
MQQNKIREENDRRMDRYFSEQKKARDYQLTIKYPKEQFKELMKTRSLFFEMATNTINGSVLTDSDVDLFCNTLNEFASKNDQLSHFSISMMLPAINFINLDKISSLQYGNIYQMLSKILKKEDEEIDPYGDVKSAGLYAVFRWFCNSKIKFRDKRLLELVEPLLKDKRYLVSRAAETAMSNLKKPGSIKP